MDLDTMSLSEIWDEIEKTANERPELIKDVNASYIFEITGDDPGTYVLIFNDGTASVDTSAEISADCTLTMSVKNLKKLLQGNLNSASAYMTGRLKVKGNIGLALKLENLLKKFNV